MLQEKYIKCSYSQLLTMNYTTLKCWIALVYVGYTQKIGEGLIELGWFCFGEILRCQVGEIMIKG